MKLVFIRHGDPDYENDTLTKQGVREAEALIPRMKQIDADYYYVSPLGRAQKTAEVALSETGKEAEVLDFLEEFPGYIFYPRRPGRLSHCWDWYPVDWAEEKIFYDTETFADHPIMAETDIRAVCDSVTQQFERFLEEHGYRKKGHTFEVLKENHDTLCFFCHFGIECVLLSYLTNISPMLLWHGFAAAPSSVTTVVTEEREKGIASFRIGSFGDLSHLNAEGIEPSFAGRYCECYTDEQRH